MLLEREAPLAALDSYLAEALAGRGRLVFLGGEAGAGKTTLVSRFAAGAGGSVRVLRGGCDGGTTPRPLGPLSDIADALGGAFQELFYGDRPGRGQLFAAVRRELGGQPTVFLLEDAHWADEATLDLVRFLGRRIDDLPVLLVATFRDDEVGPEHPLTVLLGDLATAAGVARMQVPLLTETAVATLVAAAGRDVDPVDLHRRTGGNAFYLTEVLATGGTEVPASVRDAVLARAARLSPAGQDVLATGSVIGQHADVRLLLAASGQSPAALDECVRHGVLLDAGDRVGFRHELARQAIEGSQPSARRILLHRAVLHQLLRDGSVDDRQIAHHAEACGDEEGVLRHAPRAAEAAARLGSHRQAAEHYRAALRAGHRLPEPDQAELLGRLAYSCYLTEQIDEALAAREEALLLHRRAGAARLVGDGLRWMSRLSWFQGRNQDAERYGAEAVAVLEQAAETGSELAMAYSNLSQLRMLTEDSAGALEWGGRAIELARRLGNQEVLGHALNNIGTARMNVGDLAGAADLEEALKIALAADDEEHASRAYANLAWGYFRQFRLGSAETYLRDWLRYSAARDLDAWGLYMEALEAELLAERGRYDTAGRLARSLLRRPSLAPVIRIPALATAGVLAVRHSDQRASEWLDQARSLAGPTGELQRLLPVAMASAEQAWTEDRLSDILPAIEPTWQAALALGQGWYLGPLAWWRRIGGAQIEPDLDLPEPFALLLKGTPRAAARHWAELGCPLWQAFALAGSDDLADTREALGILHDLGATATVQAVTRDLRRRGVPVPRGPRVTNPAGLTARELEVLRLLARGMSNAELAEALVLSERTVGHHVSAVLRKLDVSSRARAVALARELGITDR